MDDSGVIFIDYSVRKLDLLAGRIEACFDRLTDEQIWARGGAHENAIGNLVLHLCGNVRQWIVSGIGGAADSRDRDAEFSARAGASISDLKRRLRDTVAEAVTVLRDLPNARLLERLTIQNYEVSVLEAIYHVVEHFSMHTGQIVFAAKMLTGSDLRFYSHLRSNAAHGEKTP